MLGRQDRTRHRARGVLPPEAEDRAWHVQNARGALGLDPRWQTERYARGALGARGPRTHRTHNVPRVHRYIGNSLYTTARRVRRWWRRRWNPLDCAALSVKEMIRRSVAMLTPSWRRAQISLVRRLRLAGEGLLFF
jgi:hypothetical protein